MSPMLINSRNYILWNMLYDKGSLTGVNVELTKYNDETWWYVNSKFKIVLKFDKKIEMVCQLCGVWTIESL